MSMVEARELSLPQSSPIHCSHSCLGLTLGSCAPTPVGFIATEKSMIRLSTLADAGQAKLKSMDRKVILNNFFSLTLSRFLRRDPSFTDFKAMVFNPIRCITSMLLCRKWSRGKPLEGSY